MPGASKKSHMQPRFQSRIAYISAEHLSRHVFGHLETRGEERTFELSNYGFVRQYIFSMEKITQLPMPFVFINCSTISVVLCIYQFQARTSPLPRAKPWALLLTWSNPCPPGEKILQKYARPQKNWTKSPPREKCFTFLIQ